MEQLSTKSYRTPQFSYYFSMFSDAQTDNNSVNIIVSGTKLAKLLPRLGYRSSGAHVRN